MPRLSRDAHRIGKSVFAELTPGVAARRAQGLDLIELQIGDSCLAPPLASSAEIDRSSLRYGDVLGLRTLRRAAGDWLVRKRRVPDSFDCETELLIGAGGTHALFCAARAILDQGDEVLVCAPYWPLTTGIIAAVSAVPVEVSITQALYDNSDLDVEALLEKAATPKTRAVYLISPNNPDGFVWSREQLERVARFVARHDLWVFADEVYADFVYSESGHTPFVTIKDMFERTVSAYSFSKSLALAGARVGLVAAPREVIAIAQRVSTHTVFNVPEHEQRVVLGALQRIDEWQATARLHYREARDAACASLALAGIAHAVPHGGTYVFADLSRTHSPADLKAALVRAVDAGVMLAPGEAFGADFGSCVRICFTGEPVDRVVKGIDQFVGVLTRR